MTILRLKYIQRFKDRHGRVRYYLRRKGLKPIPLPDIASPDFLAAYQDALAKDAPDPAKLALEGPRTFARLISVWLASPRFRQLGPATQINYRRILAHMQADDYAVHLVTDFEPRNVRRFVARFADRPAAGNHRLKLFRMLFDYAVEDGWRPDNPALNIKRMKEKAEGAESWSDEHIERFCARWPSGSVPRLALALLLFTGQRRSDVVRMGASHVADGWVSVVQQKTGTALNIPIHPELAVELAQAPGGPTFLQRQNGQAFTANGFYMRFKAWRAEAGLHDGLSPHGLRKAAARRLAEAGCSTHQIASITGHSSLAEVQRYTRAVDQKRVAAEAMARMGSVKPARESVKPG